MARFYAVKSLEEAKAYLDHPILGVRLVECTEAILATNGRLILEIFGYPDNLKFRSSMTLFSCVADRESAFARALEKFFQGECDHRTMQLWA